MTSGKRPAYRFAPVLIGALAISIAGTSSAATIVVTRTNDDLGTVCDTTTCNLRAAINKAQAGDEIVFSPDLPYPVTIRLDSVLSIAKSISIRHEERGAVTLDGRPNNPANTSRHRVLEVTNLADVTITGLNIAFGSHVASAGMDGGALGNGGIGGYAAEGGCIRLANGSRLTLQSVVVSDCEAIGGRGGKGANGRDGQQGTGGSPQQNGQPGGAGGVGGSGGTGGNARGGGIFADGDLILIESSVVRSLSLGGQGGNGGNGGNGGRGGNGGAAGGTGTPGDGGQGGDGGRGGHAGEGGSAYGGGLYISTSGSLRAVNTVIARNEARAATGGSFGSGGTAGNGGNGGIGGEGGNPGPTGSAGENGSLAASGGALGGGIHAESLASGLLSFSSIAYNTSRQAEQSASTPVGGSVWGGGVGSLAQIELRNSVLAQNWRETDFVRLDNCGFAPTRTSGINMGDHSFCTPLLATTSPDITYVETGAIPMIQLGASSPALDRALDCSVQSDGVHNTLDIRGTVRPQDGDGDGIARCDLGAYEQEGRSSDVIFRTGFDS